MNPTNMYLQDAQNALVAAKEYRRDGDHTNAAYWLDEASKALKNAAQSERTWQS
jgi:hypothetical protein